MKPRSKNAILFLVIISGVVVLVAAGFALKRPLLEQWYLSRLDSEDAQKTTAAIGKLVEMRSVRAVPYLISMLLGESESQNRKSLGLAGAAPARIGSPGIPLLLEASDEDQYWREHWPARAIVAIGARGIPAIAEAIKDETWLYGFTSERLSPIFFCRR